MTPSDRLFDLCRLLGVSRFQGFADIREELHAAVDEVVDQAREWVSDELARDEWDRRQPEPATAEECDAEAARRFGR